MDLHPRDFGQGNGGRAGGFNHLSGNAPRGSLDVLKGNGHSSGGNREPGRLAR